MDDEEAIKLMKDLEGHLNEVVRQYKDFMEEVKRIVSSVVEVIP